ncbi:MAG: low specificity L-threonine aldolase [Acidobacteria bacterium 13_1_40CM_2_56_11]|nr:MAG: low specificity L-threonine aldolase [Acidobacteria bacterium 13_1_40CM_2_56_11]
MANTTIDLRSDTVTKPSAEMRRAMAEAEVGDDVFIEDPTINKLQERAAEIFGRQAALFVPSGSMGNLTCILAQTQQGQEVICEESGHVYNYEMASMSAIGGVLPRLVPGEDGILSWQAISKAIRPKIYYRSQTALIALENTHNMAGGTVYPTKLSEEICERAHDAGIRVHLDGARIFNAATYLGEDVADMTKKFDSIQFCLSKGLGAPVGSMIVGSREFIERCRSIRKMLGGGMRQAGVLAAAGLIALEKGSKRLQVDHDHAKLLATGLAAIPGITLNPAKVQTNIVIFNLKTSGWSSSDFLQTLAKRDVLAVPVDNERVRMVTHLDVDRNDVEKAAAAVQEVFLR